MIVVVVAAAVVVVAAAVVVVVAVVCKQTLLKVNSGFKFSLSPMLKILPYDTLLISGY